MRGWRATRAGAVALIFLLVMGATGADTSATWTQAGADAARTGYPGVPGPETDDVAFEIDLPNTLPWDMSIPTGPIVIDNAAYLPIPCMQLEDRDDRPDGVVRVDLATAGMEPFVLQEGCGNLAAIASDTTRLFVTTPSSVTAYHLADGEPDWTWDAPRIIDEPAVARICAQPVVTDRMVFSSCTHFYGALGGVTNFYWEGYLVALDAHTGEMIWDLTFEDQAGDLHEIAILGLSHTGNHLMATAMFGSRNSVVDIPEAEFSNQYYLMNLVAYDPDEGTRQWERPEEAGQSVVRVGPAEEALIPPREACTDPVCLKPYSGWSLHPTGTPRTVYARLQDEVHALNPNQGGDEDWNEPIGELDTQVNRTLGGFALTEDALITTSTETLYRFNPEDPSEHWRRPLDTDRDEIYGAADLILAENHLYTLTQWRDGGGGTLYAIDPESGDTLWSHELPLRPGWEGGLHVQSLADGLLIVAGTDQTLRVFGTTPASLRPHAQADRLYVDPEEEVRVDLAESRPGLFGPPTRFRAEWGDGTISPWQNSSMFTHSYAESGDVTARLIVGNDANQTASTFVTFYVGEDPPPELNLAQKMFAREHQDLTFGMLGILVALTGGAVGVTHRNRKRGRLQNELDALEEGYQDLTANPGECEAFLDTRKARARSLVLDGALAEEQGTLVENRAEELRRALRSSTLEEEFGFLPYNLVTKAREMLEDGRVTTLEAEAFFAALEEVEGLTPRQRALVEKRVEAWYAQDTGRRTH